MQLLNNDTVKQHENHHSGTWGDAEQSGGVVKNNLIKFFYEFLKYVYMAM